MSIALITIFVVSLIIALAVTWLTRELATKYGVGAYPNQRSVHQKFMPLMGGLGIYLAFIAGILLTALFDLSLFADIIARYSGILLASLIIVGLGAYDDLKSLDATKKFIGQFIAVTIIVVLGCKIETISVPFGSDIRLGFLSIPVTYLWLVGVSNAVNLLDGLDGLAAGVSLIASVVFLALAIQTADFATIILLVALIAGLMGFLRFNYHPASVFMGDTGSLFLGLILAALSIRAFENQAGSIALIVPVVTLAIPIGDTSVAFFRRLNKGKHPFKPDKDHLHHRLIYLGLSHRQAVNSIYLAAIVFGLTAYLITVQSTFFSILVLLFVFTLALLVLKRIGYLEAKQTRTYYGDRTVIKGSRDIAPLSLRRVWHKIIIGASDILMINAALLLTWWIKFESGFLHVNRPVPMDEFLLTPVTFILTVGWIILFVLNNLYNLRWDVARFDKVMHTSRVIIFGILLLFFITLDPANPFSEGRLTLLIYGGLLLFLVNGGRLIVIFIEKYFSLLEYAPHNTLLVGATDKSKKLLKNIRQNAHLLYDIVGYVRKEPTDKVFYGLKPLGVYEDIPKIIREYGIEEVIIAINERSRDALLNIVAQAENMSVVFKILPQIYDVVSGHKTEEVIGHPLIRLFPDRMYLWQWAFKRLFDLFVSFALLVFFSPVFLLIIFLQILSGIYPPFTITNVVGKFGKIYGMLNFNYRRDQSDSMPLVGKMLFYSNLYKFPELVNILLGKMSFVGPRPEKVEQIQFLKEKIKFYNRRFQIRPGFTGLAQVKYRYDKEALKHKREQFKQDLYYLENMSLIFDFRILLRSALIFFFRKSVKK